MRAVTAFALLVSLHSVPGDAFRPRLPSRRLAMRSTGEEGGNHLRSVLGGLGAAIVFASASFAGLSPVAAAEIDEPMQLQQIAPLPDAPMEIRYSALIEMVEAGDISKVLFSEDGSSLRALASDGSIYTQAALPDDPELLTILVRRDVDVNIAAHPEKPEPTRLQRLTRAVAVLLLPFALLASVMLMIGLDSDGEVSDGSPLNLLGIFRGFGAKAEAVETTFADVAGCDSAKLELEEVVDFLKNPTRYTNIGATIPRGILLHGPPGTGKTLLARAVAGEAGVGFLVASGAGFVEVFAGLGARRVRDLFNRARKEAPAIIFIDEIDAVGQRRGGSGRGGGDGGSGEREQTLNQILTEMDGFEGNPGVVVIAATNRADMLDPALLRPGRFDRRVEVSLPTLSGRLDILKVHSAGKPLASDVDLAVVARRTPRFSGAQLQNLMNEAAISAARCGRQEITGEDLEVASDRQLLGPGRSARGMSSDSRIAAARREAGRAVVAALSSDYDEVQKVALGRGTDGVGGVTVFAPSEERLESGLYSKSFLETQLAVLMAGRASEELFLQNTDDVTTAAAADLERARSIATRMVSQWGMSDLVGPMTVGGRGGRLSPAAAAAGGPAVFAAAAAGGGAEEFCGSELNRVVDKEVEALLRRAYERAQRVVRDNKQLLAALAARVAEEETVGAAEISRLVREQAVASPMMCS